MNQKIPWKPNPSISQPAMNGPATADIPIPVATMPSATGTKSRGMMSRTRLYESATIPTRTPCMARPASSTGNVVAVAHTTLPSTNTAARPRITRFLPSRSDALPISGMSVAPVRVTIETTHAMFNVWNAGAMCGIAGYTMRISKVAISEKKMITASTAKMRARGILP